MGQTTDLVLRAAVMCGIAASTLLLSGRISSAEPAACHRYIIEKVGVVSLRQAQNYVADFETLASQTMATQPDPSPTTLESLEDFAKNARAHLMSIALGRVAVGVDATNACLVCSPESIAPNPPNDNAGYPWSVLGVAMRLQAATEELVNFYPAKPEMEMMDEFSTLGLKKLSDRKKNPFCEGETGRTATAKAGAPKCYAGSYVHTAGPRAGKVLPADICIDWKSTPCAFTGKGIKKQSVTSCVPDGGITGEVFYKGGKSVRYDLAFDGNAKLVGLWWQSDGASGEWRPK